MKSGRYASVAPKVKRVVRVGFLFDGGILVLNWILSGDGDGKYSILEDFGYSGGAQGTVLEGE